MMVNTKLGNMANKYLLKLWIMTLLLGPFLFSLYELEPFKMDEVCDTIGIILIMIVFSIIFSLPTLLLALLVNFLTSNQQLKTWQFKLLSITIALIGLTVTLENTYGSVIPSLTYIYSISLLFSAAVLEYKNQINRVENFKRYRL